MVGKKEEKTLMGSGWVWTLGSVVKNSGGSNPWDILSLVSGVKMSGYWSGYRFLSVDVYFLAPWLV